MLTSRRIFFAIAFASAFCDVTQAMAEQTLSPAKAFDKAKSGEIVLVDIRTPEEWAETGSGVGANRLDMQRPDFLAELDVLLGADKSRPVAFICAGGVRSQWVVRALHKHGYSGAIDVPEGMLGSAAGPGWIAHGLPVRK
jgi:rhodanese-related sulfurtransferase